MGEETFQVIWIPWSEVETYEADGWTQVVVQEEPCMHDHYSALMVKED